MKKVKERVSSFIWKTRSTLHFSSVQISEYLTRHKLGFIVNWPQWLKAIFYLLPAMTMLLIFTFYPIVNSFMISFYTGFNIQEGKFDDFTFLGNYEYVLRQADFGAAIQNTAIIVFISVPITILLSLLIAVALSSIKALKGFYQTIFFLPYVTNTIAIGLVFAFMFSGNKFTIVDSVGLGLVNQILTWFGASPIPWIGAGATYWSAMTVILIYGVWNGLAFKIIVFLSGIQGIDKQYYQAAQIDGASRLKAFGRITVPMISPMIFYILITSVIGGFKTYSSVVAIIGKEGIITTGAAGNINLKTIVFYIYDYIALASQDGLMSYASAAAIILFGIILLFTVVQLQVGKRRVHY
ncbi:MAG: sugar ABC transporter permease [Candidatus Izemoplasmatales bacterium]|nr:sugar ABC transporter permease [Candidatus Izemoplasmatales bacterium]